MSQGGVKYVAEDMELKREYFNILKRLDIQAFRDFLFKHSPDVSKWVSTIEDDEALEFMHTIRSQQVIQNEEFVLSRNFLRARQFSYTDEEVRTKPVCGHCEWFRTVPEGEEAACMHMGSIPSDISCHEFMQSKSK